MKTRVSVCFLFIAWAMCCDTLLGVSEEVVSQTVVSQSVIINDLPGNVYAIGNGFTAGNHPEGSHFHSSNLIDLPDGNPPIILPGVAETGGFFGDEEIRGVAEFPVQDMFLRATLQFDVFDTFEAGISPIASGVDGLFGQGSYEGFIDVFAYAGNGVEEISDYEAPPIGTDPILSFEVAPGLVTGGDTFSVDVTDLINGLITNGTPNLGIRIQMANGDADAGAITFHNFRVRYESIPEPASNTLMTLSVVTACCLLRRQTRLSN